MPCSSGPSSQALPTLHCILATHTGGVLKPGHRQHALAATLEVDRLHALEFLMCHLRRTHFIMDAVKNAAASKGTTDTLGVKAFLGTARNAEGLLTEVTCGSGHF